MTESHGSEARAAIDSDVRVSTALQVRRSTGDTRAKRSSAADRNGSNVVGETMAFQDQEVAVMPAGSSPQRERQYEHIKESYEDRGVSKDEAEERAARTVNKQRAEHGEAKSSRKS